MSIRAVNEDFPIRKPPLISGNRRMIHLRPLGIVSLGHAFRSINQLYFAQFPEFFPIGA